MRFRPCIDIHNGKVKQIVGGSLKDLGDYAKENFVSEYDAAWYANYYKESGLSGGHVILLNSKDSDFYEATKKEAISALQAFPGGLMVGGGINASNAKEFIDAGASHVIITSYAFKDGVMYEDRIVQVMEAVGKEHLCLDLSCRKKDGEYYIVTDRWQKFTNEKVTPELLTRLSSYCDEFLIHAVDVEGKASGIEEPIVELLSKSEIPATYAGGVGAFADLEKLRDVGKGRVDVTIGSALSIFGGNMEYDKVLEFFEK